MDWPSQVTASASGRWAAQRSMHWMIVCSGVLGRPIAHETGWSTGLVFGGLTVGLLASGLVSMPVGRWIDHEDQGSVCFLVRTSSGEETVLVHRAREGRWLRRVEE